VLHRINAADSVLLNLNIYLNKFMKQAIYTLSKYIGLFAVCKWLTRKHIRILGYHGIWLGAGHFGNFLFMSPDKFALRMRQLKEMGVPVISLSDAVIGMNEGTLPDCATVITIDDGWYGTYKHMLPVLEKYQFPATLYATTYYSDKQTPIFNVALQYLFTVTDVQFLDANKLNVGSEALVNLALSPEKSNFIDFLQRYASQLTGEPERQQLLALLAVQLGLSYPAIVEDKLFHLANEEQLEEMARQGIDIQLHTHRHRISVDGLDCLEQELLENQSRLNRVTARPLIHFCYPSGIYDETVWPMLKKLGMVTATTTESGLANKRSHLYALPRVLDGENVSDIEFEAEISGFGEVKRSFFRKFLNK
jgi:peptidoglycan/xylan/chitin deacetylase (PgdA/CDA1 family)